MIATETKTKPPVIEHPLLSGLERGSPPTGTIWAHIGPIMGPIGRFGAHVWPRGPLFGRFMGPQGPMAHGPMVCMIDGYMFDDCTHCGNRKLVNLMLFLVPYVHPYISTHACAIHGNRNSKHHHRQENPGTRKPRTTPR